MPMYTVHVRASDFDSPTALERAVYVREGFSWAAFLLTPLWCIFRRCWLALVVWLGVGGSILLAGRYFAIAPEAIAAALVIMQIFFALEAAQFRRRSLERRGYRFADTVSGHGRDEAETRFALRCAASASPQVSQSAGQPHATVSRARGVSASDGYGLAPLGGGP